jgi:hypothetical protein
MWVDSSLKTDDLEFPYSDKIPTNTILSHIPQGEVDILNIYMQDGDSRLMDWHWKLLVHSFEINFCVFLLKDISCQKPVIYQN